MQSAVDALGHFSHEPLRFVHAGGNAILEIMLHARGRMSGLSLSRPEWHVWTIRDGKAMQVEWFKEQAAALRFAGLTNRANSKCTAELSSPLEQWQMDSERHYQALLKTGGWVSR